MKQTTIFLVLIFAFQGLAKAQDSVLRIPSKIGSLPAVTISLMGGKTVPLADKWQYIGVPTMGIDVAVSRQVSGSEPWHYSWNLPTMGIRFNYTYSPDGIAGARIGSTGFVASPFWRSKEAEQVRVFRESKSFYAIRYPVGTQTLSWLLGLGCSFYSNPFERTPNPQNEFIGSYLNCMFELGLLYSVALPNFSAVSLSAKVVHGSNGYLMKPNQGLNYLQAALEYRLPTDLRVQPLNEGIELTNSTVAASGYSEFFLSYAPGIVTPRYDDANQGFYYCHTAQMGWMRHPATRRGTPGVCALGASLDLMYNYSQMERSVAAGDPYTLPFYLGASAAVEPYWGSLSFRASMGWYLLRSEMSETAGKPFYERFGFFYHWGSTLHQFAGVSMKLHVARIDYIEWNYGIQLPIPKSRCR